MYPVESFEDIHQLVFRNPDTLILHIDSGIHIRMLHTKTDIGILIRIIRSILKQIDQRFRQPVSITEKFDILVTFHYQLLVLCR